MNRSSNRFEIPQELNDRANLIAGVWANAASGATFPVTSPVSGEVLANVPRCDRFDVDRAVAAAKAAWPAFKAVPTYERSALVNRMAELIREQAEVIAGVITMEQGKPYETEALPEVLETALNFQLAAEDVVRHETPGIPMRDPNKRVITFREPFGVMAMVTPWNFPTVIPSEYIGPALATGNTLVMKPASTTPLSLILVTKCLQQALDEAGLPKGVLNIITGPGAEVGDYLVGHPDVDMIGFTGETVTGEAICARAGIKKTLMELGGNGPHIVCSDADLAEAAKAAAYGSFLNAGQVCCATERILVHASVKDEFLRLLIAEAATWKVGDPREDGVNVGPLNNEATAVKTELHLADAVEKGATIIVGGARETGRPTSLYFPPTVIDGVTPDMLLNMEETFGPVAPVIEFATDDEAIEIANGTGYGLQMAVFTSSIKRAFYFIDRLRSGNVAINESTDYWEASEPFGGGAPRSGHGRLGGRYTLDEVTYLKTVAIDISKGLL
ncbi:MAG TPA: aldehyde dehydrogenase family protein [Coriobacteriia bacterium]|nr:aldehyde dehydrogenase family protein [Coriobacteriia bacterium]